MSGLEAVQVVASVSELVRLSYHFYKFLDRLSKADANARESLRQIKHLHSVAYGVKSALERRQEQVAKGSSPRGEEVVWSCIETSIKRCHDILLSIRSVYTPFNVETRPTFSERLIRQVRLETVNKESLVSHYTALSTQLQALQLNTQTLNTFISIGTSDRIDASKDEILDAVARLERLHQRYSEQLLELVQRREDVPMASPRLNSIPSFAVTGPQIPEMIPSIEREGQDDIDVMRGALDAAWGLISTYDPSGQSVIDRVGELDLDGTDSGLGSEDAGDEDEAHTGAHLPRMGAKVTERTHPLPSRHVKHDHESSRPFLDGCIKRYQERVEVALKKDQVHMAEADLRQLMFYTQERQEKYGIDFDQVQMKELLAQIYKRQGKHMAVFEVLAQLVPAEGSSEEHTLENSRHYQMIAETYFELWTAGEDKEDLLEADAYARSAFRIREKLTAGDELLRETAKLLADIYEALDKPVEAEVWRTMFPEETTSQRVSSPVSPLATSPLFEQTTFSSNSYTGASSMNEDIDVNKELVRAIKDRDIIKVRRILQDDNLDLDYRTRQWQTPLHYAFQKAQGNDSMPLALLERGFTIDADDEDGRTVLHQAAARADAPMIQLAIRRDANKEAKDKGWLTPLLIAVKDGPRQRERIPVLEAIEELLMQGCDAKAKDSDSWTILHHAAHNSASLRSSPKAGAIATSILELLLSKLPATALEARDRSGLTPLLQVANFGDAVTVSMLLDAGANIEARNNAHRSPLYLAMYNKPAIPKYTSVVELLVRKGAVVNEDEHNKADFAKFKHLLVKPENANLRRASKDSSRRRSDAKNSVHQMERVNTSGSSGMMSMISPSIPEAPSDTDISRPKKSMGLRSIFGRKN